MKAELQQAPVTGEVISAFKAFDKNMQCRGYQFEIGKTYTHVGKVDACKSGFHSCENPLDVLNYYPLIDDEGSLIRVATVKASGEITRHGKDSKIACASLTVEDELTLPKFVASAIKWVSDACSSKDKSSGDYSQLAASGYYSRLAASGYYSKLAASGDYSIACASAPNCTASVGKNGCIVLTRWVESEKRYRVSVGYEGENGIKAGVLYRLNDSGNFVEVK